MGTVRFTSPSMGALQAKLLATQGDLVTAIGATSMTIAERMRTEIGVLYGPVAKYWQVDVGFRRVRCHGDHPHLLYWEYGTRPHAITPVNAKALRFTAQGGPVFARRVNHPGTPAHNKRDDVLVSLSTIALSEWSSAIEALLAV